MAGLVPMAFYGLTIPAGDIVTPALKDFPATFRITMAAIDPTAEGEVKSGDAGVPRATLKIIRDPLGADDDDDDKSDEDEESDASFDEAQMKALLGDDEDEEENEDSEDDEELNGGPSDRAKTEKARKAAAVKQLQEELQAGVDDGDMEVDGINGITSKKGKGKALGDDDIDEEDDDDIAELEEFVLCTLDPAKNYQQPLDVTVGEHEQVYFKVSGTHDVHITGNFVASADGLGPRLDYDNEEESDELPYDLTPDEDEDDELDDMEDPRVTELDSEEETPKLVKAEKTAKKGKNKRAASLSDEDVEETEVGLDDIIAKTIKPDNAQVNGKQKLSKSQKKKLKNNAGEAVAALKETKPAKEDDKSKNDKKVQFAKNLEQTPSTKAEPPKSSTNGEKAKASLGVKTLQGGVKIDDKKLGSGPAAKSGNRVSMRYIGKLEKDNKVFDANKKGKPFSFKLGSGEVIRGWDIGVAGMNSGAERRITIPATLGYGSKGTNGIPPNSNLIFDVKMLEVK